MTLARLTNYVDGNTLTGAQLNNEFDNILNNGPALVGLTNPSITQVSGLSGTMISNIGSFQAVAYSLRSTTGLQSLTATSSYSINTQTAGPVANGRDQAAVFANPEVHFYAITTGLNSTRANGIASSTPPPTGPTLPAGYTAWAYLATVKYDVTASGSAADAAVTGSRVVFLPARPLFSNSAVTVETSFSIGVDSVFGAVPTLAPTYYLALSAMRVLSASVGGQGLATHRLRAASGQNYMDYITQGGSATNATGTQVYTGAGSYLPVPNVNSSPSFYYFNTITNGTSASFSAALLGYAVPNGDVG